MSHDSLRPTNINRLFKPPVDPKSHREQRIPRAVRESADFWLDVFITALSDITSAHAEDVGQFERGVGGTNPHTSGESIAHRAREIADAALVEFEERWPGIKL